MIIKTFAAATGLLMLSGTAFAGSSTLVLDHSGFTSSAAHGFAAIAQSGTNNKASITQSGSKDIGIAIQFGVGNSATIIQN